MKVNKSKAEMMFLNLGFEKDSYSDPTYFLVEGGEKTIISFSSSTKSYIAFVSFMNAKPGQKNSRSLEINMDLFKAIQEQLKELNWI